MHYVSRLLGPEMLKAAKHFPAIIVTGPRRAGSLTSSIRAAVPTVFPHSGGRHGTKPPFEGSDPE